MGTQQSGIMNLKLADLARDGQLVSAARQSARELLDDDPLLKKVENYPLRVELKRHLKSKPNWSKIS
jgi:ATP-dependent DNA helicase RecG